MSLTVQHLLVLLIVAAAAFVLLRQFVATLRGRGNKLGSCCAKGCDPNATTTPAPQGERIVFLPVESLSLRSRKK